MSRNKKTEMIIARLLTAVFLFVLISAPISVYAAGESASENESDEEYETWGEAFSDADYTDNLAENIARTWATYFVNYVGSREDVVDEVADYIGDNYDRTVSLYDNLYNYILPYSRETVNNIDGANLSTSIYGKPIRNKSNLKLIQDYTKTMENCLPAALVTIAGSKQKTGDITFDEIPSNITFADHPKVPGAIIDPNYGHCVYYYGYYGQRGNILLNNNNDNAIMYLFVLYPGNHNEGIGMSLLFPTGETGTSPYITRAMWNDYGYTNIQYSDSVNGNNPVYAGGWPNDGHIFISGSCYINIRIDTGNNYNYYYYDQSTRSLYKLKYAPTSSGLDDNEIIDTDIYEFNIINSVSFDEYNDLINQLMLDVNMSNTITNSLLIELLTELRNQRDVYQPTSDSDDIYNYIDYMMSKLLEVKDVHIEIPDITPDLGGIAEALTALLNFLASIIRTIGGIVQSLLEGLVHLFVPSQEDWDDINIQFETLTAPFGWIKEFIAEGASNISLLLFGHNVTDFDIDIVIGEGGVDPDIVYDPTSGAPKIPVRFSNSSSEYFSGIEDAYIIDMSWYTPYKPVGDIIVVAFCWLMFIWRVFHDLPGIINGATGAFDQSPQDYSGYLQKEYASWKFFGRK